MIDLSFILLTWNSKKFLNKCFDSIINKCEKEGISFEIIVIDNGSTDGSVERFGNYKNKRLDNFRFILLSSNRGTTYPRNLGLRQARGRHICILDSDTEFGSGELSPILSRLQTDQATGIVAPRLWLPDGSVQHSVKKFPSFLQKMLKVPKAVAGVQTPDLDFYPDFPFGEECPVDSAISACWFFRRELLDEVGLLDEKIFYSPEDLDFCIRVRKAGKEILYCPDFTVLHHTQQISHRKPFSRVSLSHFGGLVYYFWKHGGWISSHSFNSQVGARPSAVRVLE
jgi:GT2 family glycosyltransferase